MFSNMDFHISVQTHKFLYKLNMSISSFVVIVKAWRKFSLRSTNDQKKNKRINKCLQLEVFITYFLFFPGRGEL